VAGATAYTNQNGTVIEFYAYDALGRKTNEVVQGVSTNRYVYDPAGHLRTLTDAKNHTSAWGRSTP
jgi:YD repeat-containing protein